MVQLLTNCHTLYRQYCPWAKAVTTFSFILATTLTSPVESQSPPLSDGLTPRYDNLSLVEALRQLQIEGLKVVFTSEVVKPDMRVESEPQTSDLREVLNEILRPHGLRSLDGPNDTIIIVRDSVEPLTKTSELRGVVRSRVTSAPLAGVEIGVIETETQQLTGTDGAFSFENHQTGVFTLVARKRGFVVGQIDQISLVADEPTEVTILMNPAPVTEEELVVTPSRLSILQTSPEGLFSLSRREILALPHLGNDFFRALSLFPGVSANDVSAQFHVRGGRRDETQILLDGQELYETYHLKDYDNALSIIEPNTIDHVELKTGGFSSQFGDRMSGVLDMTSVTPDGPPRARIGLSIWAAYASGAGSFNQDKGGWLVQLRRGSTDLAGRLFNTEDPKYWDAFTKLDYSLTSRHSLRGNALYTGDELSFEEVIEEDSQAVNTNYDNSYLWLTHQAILNDRAFVDTAGSLSRVNRDRRGVELEPDTEFVVDDFRKLEVLAIRQSWSFQVGSKHLARVGLAYRAFDTEYDYFSFRDTDNPLPEVLGESEETRFMDEFIEHHGSIYLTDNFQITDRLSTELGLRYDDYSQTDESILSPRLNLAYALDETSLVRLAWGRFAQSQRPYELMVEDGDTMFYEVEQSEHRILGYEKLFPDVTGPRGLSLRAELYWRDIDNPRPRFENLFEPLNFFPEVEPDRIRVEPDRSLAKGFELFVRGNIGTRVGWWFNYAYARTEDLIEGEWFPREYDQPNAFNVDFDIRVTQKWHLNVAWRYHTGWPTTEISLQAVEDEEGEIVYEPDLGTFNDERLPDYHRFDLRASREWVLSFGELTFFVDIQNVFDRTNIAGFDIEIDSEDGELDQIVEPGLGFLPSVGFSIQF